MCTTFDINVFLCYINKHLVGFKMKKTSAPIERSFIIQHKRIALFQVRSKAVYVHDDRLCKKFVELEMKQPGYSENTTQEEHHACCKTK
jgi:hypothetical protein